MVSHSFPLSKATSQAGASSAPTIGYFHIDLAEVRTEQGKLYLFIAIDRISKFALSSFTRRLPPRSRETSCGTSSARCHIRLTENGNHFTTSGAGGSAVPDIKPAIANGERLLGALVRTGLCPERDRSSPRQAAAPMDQWPGRMDEPDHQGRDCQTIPIRDTRRASTAPRRLRRRSQFRSQAQNSGA